MLHQQPNYLDPGSPKAKRILSDPIMAPPKKPIRGTSEGCLRTDEAKRSCKTDSFEPGET